MQGGGDYACNFAVSADGSRFLVVRHEGSGISLSNSTDVRFEIRTSLAVYNRLRGSRIVAEAARRDRNGRVVMARLAKKSTLDRSFDIEFWSAVGAEGRFAATWEMVAETAAMRGIHARELRLQRSVLRTVGR